MRRLAALIPLAILAVPAGATAAEVHTDRHCYLQTPKTSVTVSGSGFSPNQPFVVALDDTALEGGAGAIDTLGAMRGTFSPPSLRRRQPQRRFDISVTAAGVTAQTSFLVTKFLAGFSPTTGDPTRMRVRFSVHGFGLVRANPNVYVHYVSPRGHLRRTVRLGHALGPCGTIRRTAKRRLFPFRPRGGKWRLQFDTSRRYRHGMAGSDFLFFTIGVTVRTQR
ncbi:MAG TPA: hypothetical protein VFT50_14010 [Baekduia sp.]|nr:hypothetical protein [Baekduia sp.]